MVALGIYRKKKQQALSIGAQRKEVAFDPGLRRSKEGHSVVWEGDPCAEFPQKPAV